MRRACLLLVLLPTLAPAQEPHVHTDRKDARIRELEAALARQGE